MITKRLSPTWKTKLRNILRRPLFVRRIVGGSMTPSFKKDQLIVATSFQAATVGSVVVAKVNNREIIKRVVKSEEHYVWLEGDNHTESTDSRRYGWIDRSAVRGVVIYPLR